MTSEVILGYVWDAADCFLSFLIPGGFEFILFFLKGCTRKTRIIDVVYNASNNELVRTKTLVKNCIVLVDSTPYRQWYEAHYALPLGRKKGAKLVRGGCVGSSQLGVAVAPWKRGGCAAGGVRLCSVARGCL